MAARTRLPTSARSTVRVAARAALVLGVVGAFCGSTSFAMAQGDKAAAESLFQAGKTMMKQGKYAEACPRFVESNRADPSVGTLLNLGQCYEKLGRTASAWAEYKEAAVLARSGGQQDREEAAKELAAALEPKLSKLRIDADAARTPGLVIRRDNSEIGHSSIGLPITVDPGEHVVTASAPGYAEWSTRIVVGSNHDERVVAVPALQKLPDAPVVVAPPIVPVAMAPAVAPPPQRAAPPPDSGGDGSQKMVGFVVGGFGVAALGLGAVMGIMASGELSDAETDETLCPKKSCTPAGREAVDSANTKALVSTIGFGIGIASLGAAAALILTAGPSAPEAKPGHASARAPRIVPAVGPGGGGVTLLGEF